MVISRLLPCGWSMDWKLSVPLPRTLHHRYPHLKPEEKKRHARWEYGWLLSLQVARRARGSLPMRFGGPGAGKLIWQSENIIKTKFHSTTWDGSCAELAPKRYWYCRGALIVRVVPVLWSVCIKGSHGVANWSGIILEVRRRSAFLSKEEQYIFGVSLNLLKGVVYHTSSSTRELVDNAGADVEGKLYSGLCELISLD